MPYGENQNSQGTSGLSEESRIMNQVMNDRGRLRTFADKDSKEWEPNTACNPCMDPRPETFCLFVLLQNTFVNETGKI